MIVNIEHIIYQKLNIWLLSTASSLTESLIYIIFGMPCLYDSPSGLFYTLYRLTLRFLV
jgi:hypothetical protein